MTWQNIFGINFQINGGYGEAVNTYDCDSYIRGFDPLWSHQKNKLFIQGIKMSKQFVLTTFNKSFEKTISDLFLCGEPLTVNSFLQEKNFNYFRGITPSHDGWGLIDGANSFFA